MINYIYVNSIFNLLMIFGNVIYFSEPYTKKEWCKDVSGSYTQLNPVMFLLMIFGYGQFAYYVAI